MRGTITKYFGRISDSRLTGWATMVVATAVTAGALNASAVGQCIPYSSALSAASSLRAAPQEAKLLVSKASRKQLPISTESPSDNGTEPSIVGLWHIEFFVGGELFQEAFQIWNAGGTEVHNPKVDPRGGTMCLGTWTTVAPRTFTLNHRVWLYDTEGNFQATGHLRETVTLGDKGTTHSGTITLELYDPFGNLVATIPGTVVGERIEP